MSLKQKRTHYYKVILLGESGVGKTALAQRFVNDFFTAQFKSTVGVDFQHMEVAVDGKPVNLQIWDTAGQERFQSLGYSYYRGADCCGLVYDITNPESFEKVAEWRELFLKNCGPVGYTFPFVLIGNKNDRSEGDKKVLSIKAQQWCKNTASMSVEEMESSQKQVKLGDLDQEQVKFINRQKRKDKNYTIPYFEVSAKTGEKVNDCFMEMAKLAVQYEQKKLFYEQQQAQMLQSSIGKDSKKDKLNEMMRETPGGPSQGDNKKKLQSEERISGGGAIVGIKLCDIKDQQKDKNNGGCGCYQS